MKRSNAIEVFRFTHPQDVFDCGDVLPSNCKKEQIGLGMVPDEKCEVFPTPYMDVIFAAGGEKPVPPVPPVPPTPTDVPSNEIWYTTTDGNVYPLEQYISMIPQVGYTYVGPAIVSNTWDEQKQMFVMVFDGEITMLGLYGKNIVGGPFFINHESGLQCNVNSVMLPNSITKIGSTSFFGSYLEDFTIPDSVTVIDDGAFWGCYSGEIYNGGKYVGDVLVNSSGISDNFVVREGTKYIEAESISCGEYPTTMVFPNTTKIIGSYALFNGGAEMSLETLTCLAETPPFINASNLGTVPDTCTIYVPKQSVDAYKSDPTWATYAGQIVALLANNQVKYEATTQLTIKSGVDYTEHTFDNGVGIVTFANDLTTLGSGWFTGTFNGYQRGNISSLTIPNGISRIEFNAFDGAVPKVYYEGTVKECIRIDKDTIDGSTAVKYYCFDGEVSEHYMSNVIVPFTFLIIDWVFEVLGDKARQVYDIISSFRIDEFPTMTANDFISLLVNGNESYPGLAQYGFTIITQEHEGVTIPLAYYSATNHFIGIAKASDYASVGRDTILPVAVNEILDADYMYWLVDDTRLA